jgi:hypothetical protein
MIMDIALVLDRIRPGAAWRRAGTYEEVEASWEDETQNLPTLEEVETDWAVIEAERAATEYERSRKDAYLAEGITTEILIVALWERAVEGRPEAADAIQVKRESIKPQYPKAE